MVPVMSLNSPAPGSRFGRYLIDERIGMGGMGVVFRATDTHLNRTVALKVMAGRLTGNDEFTQRFEREADIMTRLDSPHVVTILDHGVEDGVPWIATQFVQGGDLSDLLRESGKLPLTRASSVCAQIAEALSDAHGVGVVHRDVKPSNVLLRDGSRDEPFAYLCDFGIAHAGTTGLTQTGGVAGSWAWLAPERTKGDPGTARSDVYALGCVFWATLTGHAPYAGSDVEVALAQVQKPVPQFVGDDPATTRINAVLAKALAKDPGDRYPTAAEFRTDLLSLTRYGDRPLLEPADVAHGSDDTGTAVRTGSSASGGSRKQRSRRRWWPVAALAALALVAGTSYAVWRQQRDDDGAEQAPAAVQGDIDGDARGDLLFRWYNYGDDYKEGRNYLLRSTGQGFADPVRQPQPEGYGVRGDVDGDGRDDVVGVDDNLETKGLNVSVLDSDGTQSAVAFGKRGNRDESYPLLADIDGDGRDDLVLSWLRDLDAVRSTLELELALSTGDGFAEPTSVGSVPAWSGYGEMMTAGDVDGDGRDDLVLRRTPDARSGSTPRAELHVMLSDGDGFEAAGFPRPTPYDGPVPPPVEVADVDGDGAAEVVVYERGKPGTLRVHRFADGGLGEGEDWATDPVDDPEATTGLSLIDVDGDGRADAVLQRANTRSGVRLDVAVSTGEAFGEPERWATAACVNKGCDEVWSILTDNIT
ncbi:hypothetical protein ASG90_00185 [Nocardioides sp. Soil797]|nr:hypothetical protein ASG90_00185 [Nocardioides sp. Soil797]